MMNYTEALAYLIDQLPMYQRIGKQAFRTGLENTIRLDNYFGHPHRQFPTIHVAGTNGKGSVSHLMASVLQEAGYTVGLYTSPHLLDFRERIKVNGKLIKRKYILQFINEHRSFFDTFQPSFFEISVFLAFNYFLESRVDLAIIEVGLGGRLDATNIINPLFSIITNIGMDHTEILGNTLARIATEKAGIIKDKIPVVIGESNPETMPVFVSRAEELKAPLTVADMIYTIDTDHMANEHYQVFQVKSKGNPVYPNLRCGLLGHYQRKNTVTLLAAVDQLRNNGIQLESRIIYTGIRNVVRNTGLEGRWQIVGHHPQIICDTAHNADGLKQVFLQVAETPHENLHLILGFVSDKDTRPIFSLVPKSARFYFTRLSVPRTLHEDDLVSQARDSGILGEAFSGISDAYARCLANAGPNDLVIITGSNFLVADFLAMQKSNE